MRTTESILEEYRDADCERRLSLFLECPPLRTEFIEIEQSETSGQYSFAQCGEEKVSARGFCFLMRRWLGA